MKFLDAHENIRNLVGKKWEEIKHQKRGWKSSYPVVNENNVVIDIVDLDGNGILDYYRKNSEIFYYEEDNCYYRVNQEALKRNIEEK